MKIVRTFMTLAVLMLFNIASFAQFPLGGQALQAVEWSYEFEENGSGELLFVVEGDIPAGYHIYSMDDPNTATSLLISEMEGCVLDGDAYEITPSTLHGESKTFFNNVRIGQKLKVTGSPVRIKALVEWTACKDQMCGLAEEFALEASYEPSVVPAAELVPAVPVAVAPDEEIEANATVDSAENHSTAIEVEHGESGANIWALIIEAILWGFAMLLTPCVFPMVPMTVSFFMKGSSSKAQGRFKASMYGLFIVLLYTLPICIIILISNLLGGEAVTADIFNWLSTHWLPNIIFFVVFMVFAASFFGAFEIKLPQSLVNKSDKGADKGGLLGIFFMALTLVLVSFSCTGPIVGTVLIKSTQGEFWTPMITMLAFSLAFALPFTLLAFFPSLLKDMKKSGGSWLNSVKVVLGFIELALGLKFLSVADQTYHWGILDREVYLAIWIVIFSLLGFYFLGKIRFANDDEKVEKLSVKRLFLAIITFTFVVYMIPGMFGAPLKALSGYLPPITTQDFVIGQQGSQTSVSREPISDMGKKYDLHLPLGLEGYFSIEEGVKAAKASGKPIFLDFTGHGCVNCREMEARVWSDPSVLEKLRNDFVIVTLYTDDKTELKEEDWIRADNGKVFKQIGRGNSYIAKNRFNVSSQPAYILLSPEGEQLTQPYGYDLNIDHFHQFLDSVK